MGLSTCDNPAIRLHQLPSRDTRNKELVWLADGPSDVRGCLPPEDSPRADTVEEYAGNVHGLMAVYGRMIRPFVDVLCLFPSDCGGMHGVASFVAAWLALATTAPQPASPRLVLVTREQDAAACTLDGFQAELRRRTPIPFQNGFSGLVAHPLASGRGLRDLLHTQVEAAVADRKASGVYFNRYQFQALLNHAYEAFVHNAPFHYITASRAANPVPHGAGGHLHRFLRAFTSPPDMTSFALPVVASSFMLDAFPPGMHPFEPLAVFESIYQGIWRDVAMKLALPEEATTRLKYLISTNYSCADLASIPASHRSLLQSFRDRWATYKTSKTCLLCLFRRPANQLACGHALCEVCIRRHGSLVVLGATESWAVASCFLCAQSTQGAHFRLKPDTKGINVLSVDGGGVRAVVPLRTLDMIEEKLKPFLGAYCVQNHFAIAFGTSSGGLVVLALFLKGLTARASTEIFCALAQRAFRGRYPGSSWWYRVLDLVRSVWADAVYPSEDIEGALKEQFGSEHSLLDYSAAAARGAKVGVTITGVPQGELIATNYNGAVPHPAPHYRHALPKWGRGQIKTCDAARATAAAPWYFKPHYLPDAELAVQDGGLWQNNPLPVAFSEARALWPNIAKPDLALSLGTGYEAGKDGATPPPSPSSPMLSRGPKPPRWTWSIARTLKAFLSSPLVDGRRLHSLLQDSGYLAARAKQTFRLDVKFPQAEPGLDDLEAMQPLLRATDQQHAGNADLDTIARTLLATMFYLELTSRPLRERTGLRCQGRICCDLEPGPYLQQLITTLERHRAVFTVAGKSFRLRKPSRHVLATKGYQMPLGFRVAKRDSVFAITLRYGDPVSNTPGISGSPFTLGSLYRDQGWTHVFGRADHGPSSPPDQLGKRGRLPEALRRRTRSRVLGPETVL